MIRYTLTIGGDHILSLFEISYANLIHGDGIDIEHMRVSATNNKWTITTCARNFDEAKADFVSYLCSLNNYKLRNNSVIDLMYQATNALITEWPTEGSIGTGLKSIDIKSSRECDIPLHIELIRGAEDEFNENEISLAAIGSKVPYMNVCRITMSVEEITKTQIRDAFNPAISSGTITTFCEELPHGPTYLSIYSCINHLYNRVARAVDESETCLMNRHSFDQAMNRTKDNSEYAYRMLMALYCKAQDKTCDDMAFVNTVTHSSLNMNVRVRLIIEFGW